MGPNGTARTISRAASGFSGRCWPGIFVRDALAASCADPRSLPTDLDQAIRIDGRESSRSSFPAWPKSSIPSRRPSLIHLGRRQSSASEPRRARRSWPILCLHEDESCFPQVAQVVVEGLSKRYGTIRAVDDLSFAVRAGAVTGFLGPPI